MAGPAGVETVDQAVVAAGAQVVARPGQRR
jgi:hypothetical protein